MKRFIFQHIKHQRMIFSNTIQPGIYIGSWIERIEIQILYDTIYWKIQGGPKVVTQTFRHIVASSFTQCILIFLKCLPFVSHSRILPKWDKNLFIFSSFLFISVFFGNFWPIVIFNSYHIMFGISYSIDPEKMRALSSQMTEISSRKHMVMTWDQVIRRPH